jgi:hypothetical protein
MAGTKFTEVFDQFTMLVEDYRLIAMYEASPTDFELFLQGWLIPAIVEFAFCDQDLSYSLVTCDFVETLTNNNIITLARIMKKYWLQRAIDDVTQMQLRIQDHDFKNYSEAQNMKEKRERYILEMEAISQMLVDYSINNSIDWSAWLTGDFGI